MKTVFHWDSDALGALKLAMQMEKERIEFYENLFEKGKTG